MVISIGELILFAESFSLVLITGMVVTALGYVGFSITRATASVLEFDNPDPTVFKRIFPALWETTFQSVERKIASLDWSTQVCYTLYLIVLGVVVIIASTIFQIASMTTVAIAGTYADITVGESVYREIVALAILFAIAVLVYGNNRIRQGIIYQ